MKQYSFNSNCTNNLLYRVDEYFNFDYDFIKPLIENQWKHYINMGLCTIDEIISTYKKLDIKPSNFLVYEYFDSKNKEIYQSSSNYLLIKENVSRAERTIKQRGHNVTETYSVDQYLSLSQYVHLDAKKVLEDIFFNKFPYFNEEPFIKVDFTKNVKPLRLDSLKCLKDLNANDLVDFIENGNGIDLIKAEINANEEGIRTNKYISIYFNSYASETPLFFLSSPLSKFAYNISLGAFLNGDIDTIKQYNLKSNELFLKRKTEAEKEAILNDTLYLEVLNKAMKNKPH